MASKDRPVSELAESCRSGSAEAATQTPARTGSGEACQQCRSCSTAFPSALPPAVVPSQEATNAEPAIPPARTSHRKTGARYSRGHRSRRRLHRCARDREQARSLAPHCRPHRCAESTLSPLHPSRELPILICLPPDKEAIEVSWKLMLLQVFGGLAACCGISRVKNTSCRSEFAVPIDFFGLDQRHVFGRDRRGQDDCSQYRLHLGSRR